MNRRRSPRWSTRSWVAFLAVVVGFVAMTTPPAVAQGTAIGAIAGVVQDPAGLPMAGASVSVQGPTAARTQTDPRGAFAFPGLRPGLYTITVNMASYEPAVRADVAVVAGSPVTVTIALQPVSFSSLKTIGRTVTTSRASAINVSTAAISDIPSSAFVEQGAPQVMQVLNQIPGIVTTMGAFAISNGAVQSTVQVPQIRGALPYETESLIDGHPISVGSVGYFTPLYVDPHFLQNVEVVKGPGAVAPDINYAIGGSINYRTLEPTRDVRASLDLDQDSYGGLSTHLTTTGTAARGRLGFAFGYGIDGTPGPIHNIRAYGIPNQLGAGPDGAINGRPICGVPGDHSCLTGVASGSTYGSLVFTFPLVICCDRIDTTYDARTELAKLRYSFSQQTALTVAYLGAQSRQNVPQSFALDTSIFVPPAGYTGSVPANTVAPYMLATYQPNYNVATQGLLESELRTSLGPASLLFRYYTGAANSNNYNVPWGTTYGFTAKSWGALPIGPNGSLVFFNGQPQTYTVSQSGFFAPTQDHFNGLSGEIDVPVRNGLFSLSVDRTTHDSYAATLFELPVQNTVTIPQGSSQAFTTLLARAQLQLTPTLNATLGNYFIRYDSHYTPDGGTTWLDATHGFYGPRLGLTWQPTADEIVRFSLGSSIAPPYVTLITTPNGAPVPNNGGATSFYTQTLNNGKINPETSFGYDLGFDKRLRGDTVLSADVYETTLHGQFLNTVFQNGTYTPTQGINQGITAPLFVSEALNLGSSRYEGIELSLHKAPALGMGYRLQGSLQRAFTYNLPPGFYDTTAGPNTTNLAVIPNINFQPSGDGYNGLSNGRIPYSMGYGELNYRTRRAYYLVGLTYFGPNNTYNQPAFGVVNASARWQVAKHTSIALTGYNLTGAYDNPFFTLFGGVPVPLVNGALGATAGLNVGPANFHLILHQDIGH